MTTRWNNLWQVLALLLVVGCAEQPQTPRQAAQANFESGQWRSAVEGFTDLLATHPDDAELISMRGRALAALTQYEQALIDLTRWSELAPNDPEPLYHRAIVYEKLGEQALADADYKLAKSLDPLHQRAYEFEITSAPTQPAATARRGEADTDRDSSFRDSLGDPAEDDEEMDTLATSPSRRRAAANQAAEDSAREEAIWNRISDRVEQANSATPDVDTKSILGLGSDSESAKDTPQGALERVADQLFVPEENPTVTPVVPEYTPPTPQVSTALPTDPYGNVYTPGRQPLGTNPNAGFTMPPPGYPNSYSGQPGFTPYGDFSNPVSTALPPQLQGKLGTNAGVTQYGGTLYPPTAGTGTAQRYSPTGQTAYGPIQLPNNNPLAPTPSLNRQTPGTGIVPGRAPVSTALPPEYLRQIQQTRSTTVPAYGPGAP
jgi:tetratricopeptide (TPR) repeat protein